jgi:hypothetical protein
MPLLFSSLHLDSLRIANFNRFLDGADAPITRPDRVASPILPSGQGIDKQVPVSVV